MDSTFNDKMKNIKITFKITFNFSPIMNWLQGGLCT